MSKELTPLEALEKINHTICLNNLVKNIKWGLDKYDNCDCKDIKEFGKCYDTIETALKALEIIKKSLEHFIDYDESTKTIYIDGAIDCDNKEYDLLKEVLL